MSEDTGAAVAAGVPAALPAEAVEGDAAATKLTATERMAATLAANGTVSANDLSVRVLELFQETYGLQNTRMAKTKAWTLLKEILKEIAVITGRTEKKRIPLAGIGVFQVMKARKAKDGTDGLPVFRFKAAKKFRQELV